MILEKPIYDRKDVSFNNSMLDLNRFHYENNPQYRNILSGQSNNSEFLYELPFLHVGLFKLLNLATILPDQKNVRTMQSSSTSGIASSVHVDAQSAHLQAQSSKLILEDFLGYEFEAPLLICDSSKSLRGRNLSARIMAAMSLKPFSSDIVFLLDESNDAASLNFDRLFKLLANYDGPLLIYGFTWILWQVFHDNVIPDNIKNLLIGREIKFVHSGGWKKLEDKKIDPKIFDEFLLSISNTPGSCVIDYYGLVEQMGVIFPKCKFGRRHVPYWADVLVRDVWSMDVIVGEPGQLQLMNCITFGSPNHNVLTEDLGIVFESQCPCGRSGKSFDLLGRVPKSEVRGCSNV